MRQSPSPDRQERAQALRAARRTLTAFGTWPPDDVIELLADGQWTPQDLAGLVAPTSGARQPLGYYAGLTVPISPDPTPWVVLTWAEHLVAPAITTAEATASMSLRPAGFGKALTDRVVADCAATIRDWYNLLGYDLAPLAVAAGLTLDEARHLSASGDMTPSGLEMLAGLRRSL